MAGSEEVAVCFEELAIIIFSLEDPMALEELPKDECISSTSECSDP